MSAADLLVGNCKNPRGKPDIVHLLPEHIAASILEKERRIAEIVRRIQKLLARSLEKTRQLLESYRPGKGQRPRRR